MGKVDRTLGRELRPRRIARGDTLESLAIKLGVSDKTLGKWERGEATPCATNIRMLKKFGLIEEWLGRNVGNVRHPQGARQEANDRIARASEHPGSDQRVREKGIEDVCEHELMAVFRAFAVDERNTILEILQLVLAKLDSDS
ncbi:MAG: helix-turn-helix transcriptional regulator [Rhodospirillaceae bacterium]|nr:helix-turn-helix transcriptional regulator [Rhodospirillaceae bacterium]